MTAFSAATAPSSVTPSESAIEEPAPGYVRMSQTHWDLITALEGGTPMMRAASKARSEFYLPRLEKEEYPDWLKRVNMSYLHPGFTQGVRRLAAKPFGKALVVQNEEKLDPRIRDLIQDTDGHGKSLQQLAREVMYDGWSRGIMHIGVDLPQPKGVAPASKDGERRMIPRMLRIRPADLFNWPYSIDDWGETVLEQIRFREVGTVRTGYEMEEVDRIRVWNNDSTWELWEKGKNETWSQVEARGWSYSAGIPIATGYFLQTGFMEAESPQEGTAWLNLAHWQSASRQRWVLDFARTPFLFGTGWGKDETQGTFVVSPTKLNTVRNANATIEVVEHDGKAIAAGQADLDDLERRMDESGLKPLASKQSGTPTAAARWLDERTTVTDAQGAVAETEATLTNALRIAHEWLGLQMPDDVAVKLPGDVLLRRSAEDIARLEKARENRDIDRTTYLEEMHDRGMLREDRTVEEIEERVDAEEPDDPQGMAGLGAPPPEGPIPGQPE